MSNTLTSLERTAFAAIQDVRRQTTGLIAAVSADFDATPVPLNEYIDVPIVSGATVGDATPAATSGSGTDTSVTVRQVQLTKRRKSTFHITGDDTKVINRIGYEAWFQKRLYAAMVALTDEIEGDLAALHVKASYGAGTPGTVPFSSNHNVINTLKRLQEEAGLPDDDLHLIISTRAAENLRNLTQLTKVNEAGGDGPLRRGELWDISKFKIRTSGQIDSHTKGAASGFLTNGGESAGATGITVDTGTGAFIEGDTISVADDTSGILYIASGDVAANDLPLNGALKAALATDKAITSATHVANMAFHRRALQLAIRPTALPPGGDGASESMIVSDLPVEQGGTGLSFLVLRYGQYLQATYEVHATWGVGCTEKEGLWKLAG